MENVVYKSCNKALRERALSQPTQRSRKLIAAKSGVDASNIPVLYTQRLTLRAPTLADLPAACTLWADERVVRFIGAKPRTEAEVWTAIARSFGHWALLGYGFWAIADKATDAYLGEMGYLEAMRNLQPPNDAEWANAPEAGWALAHNAWGQGLASEALAAISQWADRELEASHTLCLIDPEHGASLALARKNGYESLREAKLDGRPTLVLGRLINSSTLA